MMTKRGMLRHKCPVCGEYIFREAHDVDFVHQCRNRDKTRMTTKTQFEKIPSRINLKFNQDDFVNLGLNPCPKLRSDKEKKDSCYNDQIVDTYIDYEGLEEE